MRDLFPDEPFRFRMGMRRGVVREFFDVRPSDRALVEERARLVSREGRALGCEGSQRVVDEAIAMLRRNVDGLADLASGSDDVERDDTTESVADPGTRLRELGARLAPDLLFLAPSARGFEVVAGVVCFPSSWSLADKVGRPLAEVHAPVPGLEAALGASLARFFEGMKPDVAFLRSGFGLSSSSALDQHPDRSIARLEADDVPSSVFVRIEDQALVKLPESGGLLFGIRIRHVALASIAHDVEALRGLLGALASMPQSVAHYKGLGGVRETLVGHLRERLEGVPADAERIA